MLKFIYFFNKTSNIDLSLLFHYRFPTLVPGHADLLDNELADMLAKTGATLPFTHVPSPLTLSLQRLDIPATLLGDETFLTTPFLSDPFAFLGGTGPSPSRPL